MEKRICQELDGNFVHGTLIVKLVKELKCVLEVIHDICKLVKIDALPASWGRRSSLAVSLRCRNVRKVWIHWVFHSATSLGCH